MERRERDFAARPATERDWLQDHTWCAACAEADLGLSDPAEYEADGRVYVEGHCTRCGVRVVSEIREAAAEPGAAADPGRG